MPTISSRSNANIKRWQRLTQSTAYRSEGLAWAEGVHLLQAMQQAGVAAQEVIVAQSAVQACAAMLEQVPAEQVFVITDPLAHNLFLLETGTRIACTVEPLTLPVQAGSCLLLDGLQDAGNVGSILRSAAAAGCGAVYLRHGCAAAWSPKVLRAAMGAHWCLPIVENLRWPAIEEMFAQTKMQWLATSLSAQQNLFDCDLRQPVLWLLGNEGAGLSQELRSLAHQQLRIPQSASVESLNVAASAAVCLFEGLRQQACKPRKPQ